MNAPSELSFEEMLRIRLEVLRREHRDLDAAIHALEETGRPDQLTLRRLKKQKLALKDQMVRIEDQLIPDIIAETRKTATPATIPLPFLCQTLTSVAGQKDRAAPCS